MKKLFAYMMIVFPVFIYSGNESFAQTKSGGKIPHFSGTPFLTLDINPYGMYNWNALPYNPALLSNFIREDHVAILPRYKSVEGDYRRRFDPRAIRNYNMEFEIVRDLGNKGKFLGTATFLREDYRDVDGSLRKDPYAGDPFFYRDTTLAHFPYDGPKVGFLYSYELFPSVHIGLGAGYGILDGLKTEYTRARTILRSFDYTFAAAYRPSGYNYIGISYKRDDARENIEARYEQLLDVETFTHRGDSYHLRRRGSSVEQTFRSISDHVELTGSLLATDRMLLEGRGIYTVKGFQVLRPLAMIKEHEEGYAQYVTYNGVASVKYFLNDRVSLQAKGNYHDTKMWARISDRNLLLWEWDYRTYGFGLGITYRTSPRVMYLLEADVAQFSADSVKYIDNHTNNFDSHGNGIHGAVEFYATDKLRFLTSAGGRWFDREPERGGDNYFFWNASAHATYRWKDNLQFYLYTKYGKSNADLHGMRKGLTHSEIVLGIKVYQ